MTKDQRNRKKIKKGVVKHEKKNEPRGNSGKAGDPVSGYSEAAAEESSEKLNTVTEESAEGHNEEAKENVQESVEVDGESKEMGSGSDDPDIYYLEPGDEFAIFTETDEGEDDDLIKSADDEPEIDYDIMLDEDFEEEKSTEGDKVIKKHRKKKRAGFICLGIFLFVVLAYLGSVWYFNSHFYPFTKINDTQMGFKSVADVETYMEEHVAGYTLTLNTNDGQTEVIEADAISIAYKKSKELKGLLTKQNPFLWPTALWDRPNITASIGVEYDDAQLAAALQNLNSVTREDQVVSVSAYPVFDGEQFVVQPEVIGNQVNMEILAEKARDHINGFVPELDMEAEGCYLKPAYVSDSQEVLDKVAELNKYLESAVTYEVSPQTEVVDKALIASWLSVDENLEIQFNTDAVRDYVYGLAVKYNTIGTTRTFTTATGNVVEVVGGNYGWRIDEESEYETLVENIKSGESISREPMFSSWGASHGTDNDYGNTYVELDLTTQHMWFIQNGEIVMETDVVTGKPSTGAATPQGSYRLTYKTMNAVLRGERYPDGTYEYESPVVYWMPFNGGIGFHDASWQAAYGGNRYITHGSHGCVNMPLSKAEALYGLIQDNTPIVLHY